MVPYYDALVQQLYSDSPSEQHQAVTALLAQPLTPHNWLSAVRAIPRLVQLVPPSLPTAAPMDLATRRLLQNISDYRGGDGGSAVAPDGVITTLVSLLGRHDTAAVSCMSALALSNLASNTDNQRRIMEAGAIAPLVHLLKSRTENVLHTVLHALYVLSLENEAGKIQIAAAGAIPPIVRLLPAVSSGKLLLNAIMVLASLAASDAQPVVEAGAIPHLVKRLTDSSAETQRMAAFALLTISNDSDTHAALLAAAPLLPMVHLLTSSSEEAQQNAILALVALSNAPTFPKLFVAAGATPPLVGLLRSGSTVAQLRALTLLGLLAKKGLPEIFAPIESAGALPLLAHLQTAAASSDTVRHNAEMLLQALTVASPSEESGKGPHSPPSSSATPVYPASAAGLPSHTAAVLPPAATSPQQQQQQQPPRPRKSCWLCGATGEPLKKCSVCSVAAYCGASCQKADWKAHKGQCGGLKAGATGSGSSAAAGEK